MTSFKWYLIIGILLIIFSIKTITATTNDELTEKGFFKVEEINGIWWLITPTGEKFYSIGVSYVEPGYFFYGNQSNWINQTKIRLDEWGINTLEGGDTRLFPDIPYIYILRLKHLIEEDGWTHTRIPDVFDTGWQKRVRMTINDTTTLLRNDPNLIGYQTDNEMKWGAEVWDDQTLLEVYMASNNSTAGKKKVIEFFKSRYDNVNDFNQAWKMNINHFNDLFNHHNFGIRGYKIRYGLAKDDIDTFSRLVAQTYFKVTDEALTSADQNHLNLGVRFFFLGVPREVLEECGKYVDVISINYYRNCRSLYDPFWYSFQRMYRCVPLDDWMSEYYKITKKPLMTSEYCFSGRDSLWPIITRPDMSWRGIFVGGQYSFSQEKRADLYEWYTVECLKRPYMVGQTWFSYQDKLNVVNWGLVDLWDKPYESLVDRMTAINHNATRIHQNGSITTNHQKQNTINNFEKWLLNQEYTNPSNRVFSIKRSKLKNPIQLRNAERIIELILEKSPEFTPTQNWYVGGNGQNNYTRIQHAIDNASDNDLVYVFNGIYNEKLIINKSIALIGQDKNNTIIQGTFKEHSNKNVVITVKSDDVKIKGFTITSKGGYFHHLHLRECNGISIENCDNCMISDTILYYLGDWGIRASQSTNTIISNNRIHTVLNKIGCTILIDKTQNTNIIKNTLSDSTICCIWISRSNNTKIYNNKILKSRYIGIILESTSQTEITGNTLRENAHTDLMLRNSDETIIDSNNFIQANTSETIPKIFDNNFVGEISNRTAFFIHSNNMTWIHNYWRRPRFLPKCILGNQGKDQYITAIAFDWQPRQSPHEYNN